MCIVHSTVAVINKDILVPMNWHFKMKKAKPAVRGEVNSEKLLRDDSLLYGTRPTSFALKFRNGRMLNATTRKNA